MEHWAFNLGRALSEADCLHRAHFRFRNQAPPKSLHGRNYLDRLLKFKRPHKVLEAFAKRFAPVERWAENLTKKDFKKLEKIVQKLKEAEEPNRYMGNLIRFKKFLGPCQKGGLPKKMTTEDVVHLYLGWEFMSSTNGAGDSTKVSKDVQNGAQSDNDH